MKTGTEKTQVSYEHKQQWCTVIPWVHRACCYECFHECHSIPASDGHILHSQCFNNNKTVVLIITEIIKHVTWSNHNITIIIITRKPSYRWQTRAMRKPAKNCSNSTCLQRCRWQYWPIFMRLAAVASKICEIPRNSLKFQTYEVQGHPRSSILVPIESSYVTCY